MNIANLSGVCRHVSAPGKVLVTGGYLVLELSGSGATVVTEEIGTAIAAFRYADALAHDAGDLPMEASSIEVSTHSPQFGTSSTYALSLVAPFRLRRQGDTRANPFIERSIEVALLAVCGCLRGGATTLGRLLSLAASVGMSIQLVLAADNDFYSQVDHLRDRGLPLSSASLRTLPPSLPCPTGMGSSAALATSLSCAILAAFGAVRVCGDAGGIVSLAGLGGLDDVTTSLDVVHRVSQVAHGLAQGKIGSGFDVCAATYGSIDYCRVSSELLAAHMSACEAALDASEINDTFNEAVALMSGPVDLAQWDYSTAAFSLPHGFSLMMADVRGGSETPSMVRKILAWKEAGGVDAASLWAELAASNTAVKQLVDRILVLHASLPADLYEAGLRMCSSSVSTSWESLGHPLCTAAAQLAAAFRQCRELLRTMGERAGVPVEPPEQCAKADATSAVNGVVCCAVPGAGGYDALFAIVIAPPDCDGLTPREAVEQLWGASTSGVVCPLMLLEGPAMGQPGAGVHASLCGDSERVAAM